jgi:cytochrome c oxidase subunit II
MNGPPAALNPSGPQAEALTNLSWVLIVTAFAVLGVVIVATAIALFGRGWIKRKLGQSWIVVAGGLAFPAIVVTALLLYSLGVTEKVAAEPVASDLRIRVTGEMWWWRVHYLEGDSILFETANEIHIPTGRAVAFELASNDVIHAFWVPQLGGKKDMIPGRTNSLRLQADEAGVFRGQCSEYCGGPHALMALQVVAESQGEYEAWAAAQATPAAAPSHPGWSLFASSGCGACHTVRGTEANGRIGPDLTHLASRRTIAAAVQPNTPETLRRFIAHAGDVKPGLRMPNYERLSEADVTAIADWLGTLR